MWVVKGALEGIALKPDHVMFWKVLQTTASRALASMPFAGQRLRELISNWTKPADECGWHT